MKKLFSLFVIVSLMAACRKRESTPPPTSPKDFSGTMYVAASYDNSGKPSVMGQDVITANLIAFLNNTLPERVDLRNSNSPLLSTSAIPDIVIKSRTEVSITFVSQGTEFSNTIAYYTYPTANPPAKPKDIVKITYVFPNAGNFTPLKPGDKVTLGTFEAGTSVGFVLLKNGWDTATKTVNNSAVHFCSNDILNPEFDPNLKKHAVLINYSAENVVLIGFEDIDRTQPNCDHDFNDVVVYATATPK
jgi:hypothetical protein